MYYTSINLSVQHASIMNLVLNGSNVADSPIFKNACVLACDISDLFSGTAVRQPERIAIGMDVIVKNAIVFLLMADCLVLASEIRKQLRAALKTLVQVLVLFTSTHVPFSDISVVVACMKGATTVSMVEAQFGKNKAVYACDAQLSQIYTGFLSVNNPDNSWTTVQQ